MSARDRYQPERFAIQKVSECGPELASLHPEMIGDAKNSMSLEEISKKYGVSGLFGVSEKIAHSIVKKALQELIPDNEERSKIYGPRKSEASRKVGKWTLENNKGVHGMTPAERTAAGKAGGTAAKEKGSGIFGMTPGELSDAGRRSNGPRSDEWFGINSVEGEDEGTFAKRLAAMPDYQLSKGAFVGSPDYTKIMEAVNERFGMNRSRSATKGFFENEKRRI